jgi:hypothetical protein
MSRWGNSKELTKASYDLVRQHPEMNRWTVRATAFGALVGGVGVCVGLALAGVGGAMSDSSSSSASSSGDTLGLVALIAGALIAIISVIAGLTAANLQLAGLVAMTDDVLHGRDADVDRARAAAHSKLGTLAGWSTISVAVGALVSTIRGDGNGGFVTIIVRNLLAGLVATVWAVVTTLVLPVIVLEQMGAVAAVKRSAHLVRSTWGEALLGSVRIGARFALTFILPGIALVVGGIVLSVGVGGAAVAAGALAVVVGVVLVVIGAVKAATCRTVFGVALYRWVTGEGALGPFSEDDLRNAVRVRDGAAVHVNA